MAIGGAASGGMFVTSSTFPPHQCDMRLGCLLLAACCLLLAACCLLLVACCLLLAACSCCCASAAAQYSCCLFAKAHCHQLRCKSRLQTPTHHVCSRRRQLEHVARDSRLQHAPDGARAQPRHQAHEQRLLLCCGVIRPIIVTLLVCCRGLCVPEAGAG